MKIRLNRYKLWIAAFFLIDIYFFSLKFVGPTIYSINSNQQEILGVICIALQLSLMLGFPLREKDLKFSRNILFFCLWYFFEFVYSYLKYGQGVVNVFIASNYCFIILLYFIVRYYLVNYDIDDFNEMVISFSLINMTLHFIQRIVSVAYIFLFFDENNMRMEELRLGHSTSALTLLGFVIALCKILNPDSRKTVKHYVTVVLGIACLLLVSRGRFTILAMFITATYLLCYRYRNNVVKILFGAIVLATAVYIFVNFTPLGQTYISSLSLEDTGSFRLLEMDYYWNKLKDSPVFGMGFIRQMGFGDNATHLVTGPNYHYSRTDVGIVGLASTFGIVGLVWYVVMLVKMGRIILHRKRSDNSLLEMLIRGVFVWNLAYLPTMIMFGPFSISVFAIELAYIDYANKLSSDIE